MIELENRPMTVPDNDPRPEPAIGHVGLRVKYLEKSRSFLELVGARTVATMPRMVILELRGGTHIVLRQDDHAPLFAGFDLMVDDIDEMRDRLLKAGYAPSKISQGGVHRSFSVIDASGVQLEFTSSHTVGPV